MQNLLLLLAAGLFFIWLVRFAWGLTGGRVKGRHPVEKRLTWIIRNEHPGHFWAFMLLQIALFFAVAWMILGLWKTPAF